MLQPYDDLIGLGKMLNLKPQWYDEHGVPRFQIFKPELCADIYADEAALVEIACQACGHRYEVAFTTDPMERGEKMLAGLDRQTPIEYRQMVMDQHKLSWGIVNEPGRIHYGDPPHGCCEAGASMNCMDLKVLQFWHRKDHKQYGEWVRDPSLEIELPDSKPSEP
jgi:hypothetical protein